MAKEQSYKFEIPDAPDFSEAKGALDNFGKVLTQNLPGELQALTQEAGLASNQIKQTMGEGLENLNLQLGEAQNRTDSAIAEARRIGSEVQQGLQSRFGSTTGTGGFAGELAGREVIRQVGSQRAKMQETAKQIAVGMKQIQQQAGVELNAVQVRLTEAKSRLRRELKERLADINVQKGMLESRKAELRFDALMTARKVEAGFEEQARNFAQEIKLKAIDLENSLKLKTMDDLNNDNSFDFDDFTVNQTPQDARYMDFSSQMSTEPSSNMSNMYGEYRDDFGIDYGDYGTGTGGS